MSEINVNNLLQPIFNSNEKSWKPSNKIPLVTKEIENLKNGLKIYINNNSEFDLAAILNESRELCHESKDVLDKMEMLRKSIEEETMAEIVKSLENHALLVEDLKTTNFRLKAVYDVIICCTQMKVYNDANEAHVYAQQAESIYTLLQYLEETSEGFQYLDIAASIKTMAQTNLTELINNLHSEWEKLVVLTIKPGTRKTKIVILINFNETDAHVDILNALQTCNELHEKVSKLSQFLLKDVLPLIMTNECTVFAESDEQMTISVSHKQNFQPTYNAVISNLRLLFHYLSNKLNLEFNSDKTVMSLIGDEIKVQFRDLLVKECLLDTIPSNINELQSYGIITSEIEDFQHFLNVIKFFTDEEFSILDYVNNIDVLFADRSSLYFLETARSIMLKDLSTTMSIGVESIPEERDITPPDVTDKNTEEALKTLAKTIPKSLFFFPRCMISKSAQELLDLLYMMMEQAVQCSDVVCKTLYNTARLVFELYDAVVPYHHENYLQTIPQYVALFHNNCMYLAHNLQTFGDKWLILMEGRDLDYPISFVDLVQKLRDLAYKHLTVHMQQQRKQILDNIRSSDLNSIIAKEVLSENAEAAVRQCLRQLQLLRSVWVGVLPTNVFTRLMAALADLVCSELVHRACSAEDISVELATQLADMYSLVVQKAPALFLDKSDVETHVKSWIKLQELIFVLGGSLKDIEKHWSDGTGPLAVHFNHNELRTLIKALFQNTHARAHLLSKIK